MAEDAEILTTRGGKRLAWLDLRQEKGPMNVAPHAVETHGVELVATVIRGAILLGGRSIVRQRVEQNRGAGRGKTVVLIPMSTPDRLGRQCFV